MQVKKSIVLAKIPKAGLANKFLVWAHAYVFAMKYKLELFEGRWFHFSIGPFLRKEKSKRFYFDMIKNGKSLAIRDQFLEKETVPKSDWSNIHLQPSKVYVFSEVPNHETYFDLIRPFRKEIIKAFYNKVNEDILKKVKNIKPPIVSIHIRMGDFKAFPWINYDWAWYKKLISDLRGKIGKNNPISIFTDGNPEEIELFNYVENLEYHYSGNDLVDMLVMANSKVLVPYPGSTFSLWAGFISESILIHRNRARIRPDNSALAFEGYPFKNGQLLKDVLIKQLINVSQDIEPMNKP